MTKIWRDYPGACDQCGSAIEVFTEAASEEGWVYDGDLIRCTHCFAEGQMSVADEESVYQSWNKDFGEQVSKLVEDKDKLNHKIYLLEQVIAGHNA